MAGTDTVGIGIISGVGQRIELGEERTLVIPTPFGPTSGPVSIGTLGGRRVAFIPRRGREDELQPHLVPYRANVWALASLGIGALITTTAAGGLRETFPPGAFVVTDQLIDRTWGRDPTVYDVGPAVQVSAADPFDATLRGLAVEALTSQRVRLREFGTAVVAQGPRFATRAESRWHAAAGADIVTTTLLPETTLALELGVAVVNVAFVTDADAGSGSDHSEAVSVDVIRRRMAQARPVLIRTVSEIARTVPAGYRAPSSVPQEAIARALARPPV